MTAMLLALLVSIVAAPQTGAGDRIPYVVFVCEHGAAQSLIATAYFNKLAAERGLAAIAAFRGVDPENRYSHKVLGTRGATPYTGSGLVPRRSREASAN